MRSERVFYLVSTEPDAGLTSVALGMVRALDREGIRVAFYKPVHQPDGASRHSDHDSNNNHPHHHSDASHCSNCSDSDSDAAGSSMYVSQDPSTHFVRATGNFDPPQPFAYRYAQAALKSSKGLAQLLEGVVEHFEDAVKNQNASVVVVEGLAPTKPGLEHLNTEMAKALDAQVILVMSMNQYDERFGCSEEKMNHEDSLKGLKERVQHAKNVFGERRVVGCIVTKVNSPCGAVPLSTRRLHKFPPRNVSVEDLSGLFKTHLHGLRLLGAIPWSQRLLNVRTSDMAEHLGATVLYRGDMNRRRVDDICLVARNVSHMIDRLRRDTLIITPNDREDILLAACMAELNGTPLAGVVMTGGVSGGPCKEVLALCDKTLKETGMPLLLLDNDSYVAATRAATMSKEVPMDDILRIERVMDKVAQNLDMDIMREYLLGQQIVSEPPRLSPHAFVHQLVVRARKANRRIVLPEGNDPRVLRAAVECQSRGIARCVLLGEPEEIRRLAVAQGILEMPPGLEIMEPTTELREKYVGAMVELRKHKGMTEPVARAQLEDITVLGTMMVATGEADGLASGAVHTTANTIRPALQLIKARPNAAIVSSVFFMLLPDQVLLYGDCAINQHPSPAELASIAIESAESAKTFGIDPRIAMLSYSTGSSGNGSDVEAVREATRLVKEQRPDLIVDGPLQYDAACDMDVAKSKAPNSPVAGQATVLIFPDLNTGNTTYKAVQRTANVVCMGPMLQGLRRPVNDLSRGASVEDIVGTIALTSIQAEQCETLSQ